MAGTDPVRRARETAGGEGTSLVAEFSPATLAARAGLSSYAGRELVADARDLSNRLPRLWERVQALEVRAHYARFVAGWWRAEGAGQSRVGNYGPMTIRHHRIKTFGRWQVRQPFPGIYVWRDPYGAFYLVDHSGIRRITQDSAAA